MNKQNHGLLPSIIAVISVTLLLLYGMTFMNIIEFWGHQSTLKENSELGQTDMNELSQKYPTNITTHEKSNILNSTDTYEGKNPDPQNTGGVVSGVAYNLGQKNKTLTSFKDKITKKPSLPYILLGLIVIVIVFDLVKVYILEKHEHGGSD